MNDQLMDDDKSIEEKLQLIEQAMQNAQAKADEEAAKSGTAGAPIDPASLTICDGCE